MSWIQNHWEKKFVDDAETKLKQLMIEYCEQAAAYEEDPLPSVQPGGIDTRLPLYMSLAGKYGLDDDDNMDIDELYSIPHTVFSSSAETDTKKQNRIKPLLMEALQMLKYYLKKESLSFTEGWSLDEEELIKDAPEEDLLHKLVNDNSQNTMDRVMRSLGDYNITSTHILPMIV
ncbi:hypothetical protein DFH94DRAFT_693162 [Russula ochroleuca]|uniref:Uncharacterized protein n=1 Tax=Russula ochroleuca TaxID=152965 RepID=A0A9P5T8F2_9AGAM|nr:hypothetical protein DFH94DRAFT_693162 [Russula ochroleuca]